MAAVTYDGHSRNKGVGRRPSLVVAIAVWLTALACSSAYAETRVALVIGNAAYETRRLKNPRNDAELMAARLTDVGFQVLTVYDGDGAAMRNAIAEFARRLAAPDAVALFYYAGHGVQADGENYLVPLRAEIADLAGVATQGVALGRVLEVMANSKSRLNIVVLDACRDNPFRGEETRGIGSGGLAPVTAPSGTLIAYATAPGQVARDGDGSNSPYTAALAENLPLAGLTLEEVFRNTRRRVLEVTNGRQTPWEHSSLVGAFFFKPKMSEPEASSARGDPPASGDERLKEIADWEAIKATKDPELLKSHVTRYPDGLFAELAAVRLSKLEAMRAQTPWSWMMTGGVERDVGREQAAATFERAVKLEADAVTPSDRKVVASLYAEAAAAGLPNAMFALGRAHDKGLGVARDLVEAARWYEMAADAGHAGAMAALGTMYEFGEGAAANLASALRLYRLSADANDASGLTSLAYLYATGKGVARNPREARRLYGLAADRDHPRALYNLALMEIKGEGGAADLVRAVRRLQTASEKGHARAHLELAYLYDEGRGVARNPKLAARHFIAALQMAAKDAQKIPVVGRAWTFATRREVQRQLADTGLYKGAIHGYFNRDTEKALIAVAQR